MQHLVIFDIDGTLGNTNQLDHDCFKSAIKKVSGVAELPLDLWAGCPHITDTGVTQHLYQKLFSRFATDDELKQIQVQLLECIYTEVSTTDQTKYIIPGAKEFFNALKEEGAFATAIATGCWKSNAEAKLDLLGIYTGNLPIATADCFLSRKQITIEAIAQSLHYYEVSRFSNITYIGDGIWDFTTAAGLGINFIGIDCQRDNQLKQAGAVDVIHDYLNTNLIFQLLNK